MTLKGRKTEEENCDQQRLTFFRAKRRRRRHQGGWKNAAAGRSSYSSFLNLFLIAIVMHRLSSLFVQLRDIPVRNRKKNETGPWKEEEQKIRGSNASAAKKEREIFNLIMRKTLERILFSCAEGTRGYKIFRKCLLRLAEGFSSSSCMPVVALNRLGKGPILVFLLLRPPSRKFLLLKI